MQAEEKERRVSQKEGQSSIAGLISSVKDREGSCELLSSVLDREVIFLT